MANRYSFTITKSNNKIEREGIDYLLSIDERFIFPDKVSRKKILDILGLDKKYSRTFDLIFIEDYKSINNNVIIDDPSSITLIELKTTKKELPNNPKGFFFGATENEFTLATKLGNQYKFCFVCLHPKCTSYKILTLEELNKLIRNKRIQFQINL